MCHVDPSIAHICKWYICLTCWVHLVMMLYYCSINWEGFWIKNIVDNYWFSEYLSRGSRIVVVFWVFVMLWVLRFLLWYVRKCVMRILGGGKKWCGWKSYSTTTMLNKQGYPYLNHSSIRQRVVEWLGYTSVRRSGSWAPSRGRYSGSFRVGGCHWT